MPYGKPIAVVPCDVKPEFRDTQQRFIELIQCARDVERLRKQVLELEKDLKMLEKVGTSDENKAARKEYLRTVYVPTLRTIGITRATLTQCMPKGFTLTDTAVVAPGGEELFKLYEGEAAFERIQPNEALARDLYTKKGLTGVNGDGHKTYVKDDSGRFTRRYAYVEKAWDVFLILLERTELKGKDVDKKLGGDPYSKGSFAKAKYDFPETGSDGRMSTREMAFVNQEDGSNVQRALALGSTSKPLHGNEGYRFGKMDGVRLVIDLARISVDQEQENSVLLNLYCYDAQRGDKDTQTIGLTTYRFDANPRKVSKDPQGTRERVLGDAAESKEHTDWSTSKNRELVTLKIPLAAVTKVIFHDEVKYRDHAEGVKAAFAKAGVTRTVELACEPHTAVLPEELYPE